MIEGVFGFEIFNSWIFLFVFFGGGSENLASMFLGDLDLSRDFSGYSKQSEDSW